MSTNSVPSWTIDMDDDAGFLIHYMIRWWNSTSKLTLMGLDLWLNQDVPSHQLLLHWDMIHTPSSHLQSSFRSAEVSNPYICEESRLYECGDLPPVIVIIKACSQTQWKLLDVRRRCHKQFLWMITWDIQLKWWIGLGHLDIPRVNFSPTPSIVVPDVYGIHWPITHQPSEMYQAYGEGHLNQMAPLVWEAVMV